MIVFTMSYITPGDPAEILLGDNATTESIQALREEMGLNDPYFVRFGRFLSDLVFKGDLGTSYSTKQPVTEELMSRFPNTLQLSLAAVFVSVFLGLLLGIISAVKQYSLFDNLAMSLALIGVSMPNFWQGLLLILLFSVQLGWLPSSGFTSWKHVILPAITIGTSSCAIVARMTRSSMLEVIRQDYIVTARSKGQKELVVVMRHALKNALIPIVTIVGIQFGHLLGGSVLTESVFSIPGLGKLMVDSIKSRNFPVVQGGVLYVAIIFSFVNLLVDILYAFIDPRIRSQYR